MIRGRREWGFVLGHVSGDEVFLVFVWVVGSTSAGKGIFGDRSEGFDGFAHRLGDRAEHFDDKNKGVLIYCLKTKHH